MACHNRSTERWSAVQKGIFAGMIKHALHLSTKSLNKTGVWSQKGEATKAVAWRSVVSVFHHCFSATITAFIMHTVIEISLNDRRETNRRGETIAALWQRDPPRLILSVCERQCVCLRGGLCVWVFGLLVVNSEMNLNGHHLTFHLSLYAHSHTHSKSWFTGWGMEWWVECWGY